MFTFDWLRGKAGVFTPTEEQQIIQWIQYLAPSVDSVYTTVTPGGNAALDNFDIPLATAGYLLYQVLQGNPYTTFSASSVSTKVNMYANHLRNGAHDFDNFPPEGMNYHVYSMPSLFYAGLSIEKNGYAPVIDQSIAMGVTIGDLYMGSGTGGIPSCPSGPIPLITLTEGGKWFMYDVEATACDKGIKGYSLAYLVGLNRLYQTDPWKAKRGISRVFEIDAILGPSGYRSDQLSSMSSGILPALFYNDSLPVISNLDAEGYLPAAFHKDQKNAAPPNAAYNGFDLNGDGGFHMGFNKLDGVQRVGYLYITRDGYMQHLHGSEDGSTELYAGWFPVEVSPGRGTYPFSPGGSINVAGHSKIAHNTFLPDSAGGAITSAPNYYGPTAFGNSQHNYEGQFHFHLEGFFVSGAQAQHKRIWEMDCVTCIANRFVGIVSDPDDITYVFEYAETKASGATTIRKRSHSLVQATSVTPASGQTAGYGYKVENNGNKGITRFFHPLTPTLTLPSSTTVVGQKPVYTNSISQTTTSSNLEADWLYITELIPNGNTRQTPHLASLSLPPAQGYGGIIDWTSNGLNKGYKDFIIARHHSSPTLSFTTPDISVETNANMLIVRKSTNGAILQFAAFNTTNVTVDNQPLLFTGGEYISASMGPGVQIQMVDLQQTPSTLAIYAPASSVTSVPGNAIPVTVNGQPISYAQQGDYVTIGNVILGGGSLQTPLLLTPQQKTAGQLATWSIPAPNVPDNTPVQIELLERDGSQTYTYQTPSGEGFETVTKTVQNGEVNYNWWTQWGPYDGTTDPIEVVIRATNLNDPAQIVTSAQFTRVYKPHESVIAAPTPLIGGQQGTVTLTNTAPNPQNDVALVIASPIQSAATPLLLSSSLGNLFPQIGINQGFFNPSEVIILHNGNFPASGVLTMNYPVPSGYPYFYIQYSVTKAVGSLYSIPRSTDPQYTIPAGDQYITSRVFAVPSVTPPPASNFFMIDYIDSTYSLPALFKKTFSPFFSRVFDK